MRPAGLGRYLELDLGGRLVGDVADQIVLAVREVDLPHVGLIEVLAGNGDHVACLPTRRIDRRHAGHRLLGAQHESRKSRGEQKRDYRRQFHLNIRSFDSDGMSIESEIQALQTIHVKCDYSEWGETEWQTGERRPRSAYSPCSLPLCFPARRSNSIATSARFFPTSALPAMVRTRPSARRNCASTRKRAPGSNWAKAASPSCRAIRSAANWCAG